MDIIETLDSFNQKFKDLNKIKEDLKQERIQWCRKNRNEIKKLFPTVNKIYKIISIEDVETSDSLAGIKNLNLNENYYFKPTLVNFNPHLDFNNTHGTETIKIGGIILSQDLKILTLCYREVIYVNLNNITEKISEETLKNHDNNFTNIYVMLDKNTGYYKIGRSITPKRREKTLQSEKPTIEMLFYKESINKTEKELHIMYKEKRIRGEWFNLNGNDLNNIKNYLQIF